MEADPMPNSLDAELAALEEELRQLRAGTSKVGAAAELFARIEELRRELFLEATTKPPVASDDASND